MKFFYNNANKLRPYHARVNALIGNCAIVYESDEEFGTLPVITPEHVDLNLPSVKICLLYTSPSPRD